MSTIVRMLMASYGGMSQTELATAIGYTQPAVSDKLTHRRKWTIDDLWVLSDYFDVDVELFFRDPRELVRTGSFTSLAGLPATSTPELALRPPFQHLSVVSPV